MRNPIIIKGNQVTADFSFSFNLNSLRMFSGFPRQRRFTLQMEDLRFQLQSYCHHDSDLQFSHRHGFPSNLKGLGRGLPERIYDIVNHPLSYILQCEKCHEDYDSDTREWKNRYKH